jgi:serine/threonine-protein kinase HipA
LKNWALVYPDARSPVLSPLYDPVCVTALFESVEPEDYGVNRAIDRTLRAFTWGELEALLKKAGLNRIPNHLRLAKELVRQAKADWPRLLAEAPPSVARAVTERLEGGVALAN